MYIYFLKPTVLCSKIFKDMNFFYETNSNGTIYNLMANQFLNEFTFEAFDKILAKTQNKDGILDKDSCDSTW